MGLGFRLGFIGALGLRSTSNLRFRAFGLCVFQGFKVSIRCKVVRASGGAPAGVMGQLSRA